MLIVAILTPALAQPGGDPSAQKIVKICNHIRKQHKLPPLKVAEELNVSAANYAQCMADNNFFSHTGRDGSTCVSRNVKAGYTNWYKFAENLAAGQETPEEAVRAWMKSKTHRANILSKDLKETGVGCAYRKDSKYGYYWVQEFGTRKPRIKEVKGKTRYKANGGNV